MLYSVVFSSVAGTDDAAVVETTYSVVLILVEGTDDGEDVISGG